MSTRVRLFGQHPKYGVSYGPYIRKYVTASYKDKFGGLDPIQYAPLFATWPTWKRLMWMAKWEGKWQIFCFREPRKSDIRKSLYGKMFAKFKINLPALVKKPRAKKVDKAVIPGGIIAANGNPAAPQGWNVQYQWHVAAGAAPAGVAQAIARRRNDLRPQAQVQRRGNNYFLDEEGPF